MKQSQALAIMHAGHSALLTGPAGAGKTYVLNRFIREAKAQGRHVSVTATTGLAATHLGGTTIHSWSGIGINDYLMSGFLERLSKGKQDIIRKTHVLVIDEISMMHDFRLDMVDEVCRAVREEPDLPFGGLQIIMSGDFFQLPPINRREGRQGGFVVNSKAWQELEPAICYLEEQHRQKNGMLLDILTALREGSLKQRHVDTLIERGEVYPDDVQDLTQLFTVNVDVDAMNEARLKELEEDEVSFDRREDGAKGFVDVLDKSILAPKTLRVKRGALVMAVRNSQERKYVNGSIGTVVEFDPETNYPIVQFRNGKEVLMMPETWELHDGDKKRASITQIPLRLAWAVTVHKSQGMTLDAARIDLSKAFVEGMGYVALSRVKDIENLYLSGLNQMALRVSEEARSIDAYLREKAEADAARLTKA